MFGHRVRSAAEGRTPKLTCRGAQRDVEPRKRSMPPRSGAATGSAAATCSLRSLHGSVDLALLRQPGHVSPLGVLLDLSEELYRFRFVARLTRVIDRDDHLDFYRNHILLGLNQACPPDPLSGNTHG